MALDVVIADWLSLQKFFNVQIAEFSVDVMAVWKDEKLTRFEEVAEETSSDIAESVEIRCEQLDDGKHYFISHAVDAGVMECGDE